LRQFLLVFTIEILLRLARLFWRVRLVRCPFDGTPRLYAHWHGDELLLLPVFAHQGFAVMSSRSKDGEAMARLLGRMGYFVVRGSSSRGGAGALKGLIDSVRREKRSAAIAVDGPRGPLHKVKPGILALAQSTGLPIIPAGVAASRKWNIRGAWNQGFVPKPFARCVVVFGEALKVPADAGDSALEVLRIELEARLMDLKKEAVQTTSGTATKSSSESSSKPW
jgi:lysophospholipid acyltransferase (LPLAT)-like uncharacterized protein